MNDRTGLTFSQSEGYEEVPGPLRLEELPGKARVAIWNVLYKHLQETCSSYRGRLYVSGWMEDILRDVHAWYDSLPLDEWATNFDSVSAALRFRVEAEPFNKVFDLLQYIMQHRQCALVLVRELIAVFRSCQLAYIIDSGPPPSIYPAATPEEGDQLAHNLNDLQAPSLNPCSSHLRNASKCINAGDPAGSIRESIHAIESVARQIHANAKTLGPALAALEKQGKLHPALKQALSNLYGYTSDEQGVRHALLDQAEANVTIDEAVFMLGACASFASYLWRKHQAAGNP